MSDRPSILEDAIEALGFARQGTIAEANNIPDDRWDYRSHPGFEEYQKSSDSS